MRDIHHTGVHGYWCNCDECTPYVPADRPTMGHYTRRVEVALTMLIVFALVVWAVSR